MLHSVFLTLPLPGSVTVLSMGNSGTMLSTTDLEGAEDQLSDVPVYEEYNALLHGASRKKTLVTTELPTHSIYR